MQGNRVSEKDKLWKRLLLRFKIQKKELVKGFKFRERESIMLMFRMQWDTLIRSDFKGSECSKELVEEVK